MPRILHIETSTRACSTGLSQNGKMLAIRESLDREYSHSSRLTVFIDEVIREAGMKTTDVDAVAVSGGPGSYTGLRIGVSTAKGFCYARDIPLIATDTMKALTRVAMDKLAASSNLLPATAIQALFCPMIDARRMEVYNAIFDSKLSLVRKTKASIIDEDSFRNRLKDHKMFFFGDGAGKCSSIIQSPNAMFLDDVWPSATGMLQEAESAYSRREFADLAYYEPFYLKDFVAGKPKVKGLYA